MTAWSMQGSQNASELLESGVPALESSSACWQHKYADVVELVDTLVLEASASAWEFESPHPHQSRRFPPGRAIMFFSRPAGFSPAIAPRSPIPGPDSAFAMPFRPFFVNSAENRRFLHENLPLSAFLCLGRGGRWHILIGEAGWKALFQAKRSIPTAEVKTGDGRVVASDRYRLASSVVATQSGPLF